MNAIKTLHLGWLLGWLRGWRHPAVAALFAVGGVGSLHFCLTTSSSTIAFSTMLVACEEVDAGKDGSSSSSSATADGSSPTATGPQAIDAPALCTRLISECGQALTMSECTNSFGVLRVSPTCITRLGGATCADLTSSTSAVLTTCFPPCSGAPATCNPDGTLTYCSATGVTNVASCQDSCKVQGTTFSGTCGKSFEGQVAAQAQCWCN